MSANPPDPAASPTPTPPASPLGRRERMLLAAVAAVLALALIWMRGGLNPAGQLEQLARQSPDLPVALADGRPTLVEFYADWCEACRAMAPAMTQLEQHHRGKLDVVMLNVDNPRWQPELEHYDVSGIPQLELFDGAGQAVGRSIGARSGNELESLVQALIAGSPLPELAGVGATSHLEGDELSGDPAQATAQAPTQTMASPRSHG